MEDIVYRLLDFEKRFGKEILSDKTKLPALIKDYFPEALKEQRIIAKGLELDIYNKIVNASVSQILQYKKLVTEELCEEHGTNTIFAEAVVDLWIHLIEKKRKIKIIQKNHHRTKGEEAIAAYEKNMKSDDSQLDVSGELEESAIYKQLDSEDLDAVEAAITKKTRKTLERPRPGGPAVSRMASKSTSSTANRLLHTAVKEAFDEFLHLAENDDPSAQGIIGMCYYVGKNVPKDYVKAAEWFEKAALKGQRQSQNLLGYCYFHGYGVNQDYRKAVLWFTKAAFQGDSSAQLILGRCFFNGLGVDRNLEKAILWYKEAAKQNLAEAQFALGECYYYGEGVRKNKYTALKWFEKAASQNHDQAILYVAELSDLKLRFLSEFESERNWSAKNLIQNERYAKKYTRDLLESIRDIELLKKFMIHSTENNIIPFITHKIGGLALNLDEYEHPLFIFNTGKKATISLFSDYMLFTTKGLYISQSFKKRKFIYHADINVITHKEHEIILNDYTIPLIDFPEGSALLVSKIIQDIVRHFR